jgi:D-amino-acid dehydrogenase
MVEVVSKKSIGKPMQEQTKTDILIVGAGIIGLACAYYLAKEGYQVQVIEKDSIGAGASHGNCGLLFFSEILPLCQPGTVVNELGHLFKPTSPLFIKLDYDLSKWFWLLRFAAKCNRSHLQHALTAREKLLYLSRQLYQELMYQEQLACDWQRRGVLVVYKNQAAMDGYEKINQWLLPYGLGAKPLGKSQLLKMEPALNSSVCGAWHHEIDSHVRPENLVAALAAAAAQKGVQIHENCELINLGTSKGRISTVRTDKGIFRARFVVLAAGAWAPQIVKPLSVRLPIQPAKGYSITLQRPQTCPRIACLLHEPRVVATPWQDGLRLGGTLEFSGFNLRIDQARLDNLKQAARDYLRTSEPQKITEEWVGLRPMTYDDLPIIGRLPAWSNLFLACGHGMMGMTMAAGTGRALADLINDRDPGIDLTPFSPTRFS